MAFSKAIVRRTESQGQEQQPCVEPGTWGSWRHLAKSPHYIPTTSILGRLFVCPQDHSETKARYRTAGGHPSAKGTLSPLRRTGWLLPSGNPTRTKESGDSQGLRARAWHGPAQVDYLLQRTWDKCLYTQNGSGTLLLPSAMLQAVDKTSQPHLAVRLGHGHQRGLGPSDHALDIWKTPGALTP